MKKLPEKLRSYSGYEYIKFSLQNVAYDSLTHEDFEERWNRFIDKQNLHDNQWLLGLYNERRRWVPAFVRDTFWADTYTIAKFKEFQQELAAKLYYELSSSKEIDSYMEFIVEEDVMVGETHRSVPFVVCFNEANCDVRCYCRLFEFRGILCRHAITVLIHKKISHVLEKYILRRWRKNINRCHTKVKISYNSWSTNVQGQQFDKLSNLFSTVTDLASNTEDDCNMVIEMINDMKNKLMLNESAGKIDKRLNMSANNRTNSEVVAGTSREGSSNILTPRVVRSKGRPPFKRKQSKVEQIVRKVKEKKLRKQAIAMTSNPRRRIGFNQATQESNKLDLQEVGCSSSTTEGQQLQALALD
ncbi:protein FAR1-RELATED SEQUENCE 6-like [Pistacia vera]|uniref:protein FAR1-RELATED SEQUENCE 6-like n=1 Tax=Pistacia vera TaxID=55513 RepID=UPI001263151A|nr:protein FAR1-RELATED SEQUENCE 6-like [Pistacia vera]